MKYLFFVVGLIFLQNSCINRMEDVNNLVTGPDIKIEEAQNVVLLYSDSAQVKVKVVAPILYRHLDKSNPRDEFAKGLKVEFLDSLHRVISWMEAKYAVRYEKTGQIIARDSVVLFNLKNEKLKTSELFWDESSSILETNKAVIIIRPEKGDTIFGYGMIADQDFSRFEIKRKFSAKMRNEGLLNILTPQDSITN